MPSAASFFFICLNCSCLFSGAYGLVQQVGICYGWIYRSDFDSCYLMLNRTGNDTMTWQEARTECQDSSNDTNKNIVTSEGQNKSDSSVADLLTISYGSEEEAFIFSNMWKDEGSLIGWIGATFSNVSLLPSLEYSESNWYSGQCNNTLGSNASNSETATYGSIFLNVNGDYIADINCYWAIFAPIGTTVKQWKVTINNVVINGDLSLLDDSDSIVQSVSPNTTSKLYYLKTTRLAIHFYLNVYLSYGGYFSLTYEAVLAPKFGMKALWLNGSQMDSWSYNYLTGYKDSQLASSTLADACFAGRAFTSNYAIAPNKCDEEYTLAYCKMQAPRCYRNGAPKLSYTSVSGSEYYNKNLNYTCFPGTLFEDGSVTKLLRCDYTVINGSFLQLYWKNITGSVSNCSIQRCAPPADLSLPNVTFDYLNYYTAASYKSPSLCAPNADGSGDKPLSAYCVNTSIYYTCPNGVERTTTCLWNSTSRTAYWNDTQNCFAVCPSPAANSYHPLTFYYSADSGKCYSDPIGSQITPFWPYWQYYEYNDEDPYNTCNNGYGAQVLSIVSAVEQSFVMRIVLAATANVSNNLWLNGYYDGNSIYWINNDYSTSPLLYNNFPPEFDLTTFSAGCIYMNTSSGFWNLQDCLQNAYYSCEYTPPGCEAIPHVNNTNVSTNSTSWQTVVVYTCLSGYQVYRSNGSQSSGVITQNISCEFQNSSGLLYWKGAEALRSCIPLNCNPQVAPQNASLISTTYAAPPNNWSDTSVSINGLYFVGSILQYKCPTNHVFNTNIQYQINMTCNNTTSSYIADWDPTSPQCVPILCSGYPITQPPYSTISTSSQSSNNFIDTVLNYTCNTNYIFNDQLSTSKSYTCIVNGTIGTWSAQQNNSWYGCLVTNPQHEVLAYLSSQLKLLNYSRAIRPRVNFNSMLTLELKFVLNYIEDLDSNGHFTTLGNFLARWSDDYLAWSQMNNSEFYTSQLAEIPASMIWLPQPSLFNTMTGGARLDFSNQTVKVAQDGTVLSQLFMEIESICEMEVYAFPFDTQTCELTYQFDVFSASEVSFKKIEYNVSGQYKPNNYWLLVQDKDDTTEVNVTVLSTTALQTQRKSRYTYSVTMNRNPSNAVYTVIVPLAIISVFSIFAYIVPLDGETRMNILTAVFLSFIFLQGIIQTVVPHENNPPAISNYILVSMILASLNIIFSSVLLWVKYSFRKLPAFLTADRLRRWRNLKFFCKQQTSDSENTEKIKDNLRIQMRSALNLRNYASMNESTSPQLCENYQSGVTNVSSSANGFNHIERQYIVSNDDEQHQQQNVSQNEEVKALIAYTRYVAFTALQQEETVQNEKVPENVIELMLLLNRVVGFILMLVHLGWGLYTALILSGVIKKANA